MFGTWYLILSMTSRISSKEVKKSSESQRVTQLLQSLTNDIQGSRKTLMNRESWKKTEFNMD